MNKYIKHMAIVAVAAVAFSAQAKAASVCVSFGNGASVSICDGKQKQAKHRVVHDIRNRHHLDHCRDCRRADLSRRAHHAQHKHHR